MSHVIKAPTCVILKEKTKIDYLNTCSKLVLKEGLLVCP